MAIKKINISLLADVLRDNNQAIRIGINKALTELTTQIETK